MRPIDEYRITSNNYVYNRLRKHYLANKGEIHCSFCGYHDNENNTTEWYGGYSTFGYGRDEDGNKLFSKRVEFKKIRYPNWKLVSKNGKQWMKKSMKTRLIRNDYYKFVF